MSCNVAFIGLGVMGYPMAGYISKGGHNVTVFNRTKSKAEKWIGEYKGKMANTPAEAADGADFIFTCVGNDDDLREVATGENGLFNTAKAGSIFIDNSTVSAEVSRELNKKANEKQIVALNEVEALTRNAEIISAMGMITNVSNQWEPLNNAVSDHANKAAKRASVIAAITKSMGSSSINFPTSLETIIGFSLLLETVIDPTSSLDTFLKFFIFILALIFFKIFKKKHLTLKRIFSPISLKYSPSCLGVIPSRLVFDVSVISVSLNYL